MDPELEGALIAKRTQPSENPPQSPWQPPSDPVIALESQAVQRVLAGFLAGHPEVFEVGPQLTEAGLPNLQLDEYSHGRFARRAVFSQTLADMPLIGGSHGGAF